VIDESLIRGTVQRYAVAWGKRDRDLWLSSFSRNAIQIDPVGSPPREGIAAIAAFWDRAMDTYSHIELHPLVLYVCGNQAALTWEILGQDRAGWVSFDGVDTFVFTDRGRIASVRGYWRQDGKRRHASRPERGVDGSLESIGDGRP
jgi:steroid Delta-isomerase